MASKIANVTARVEPDIKEQAETILSRLGLSVSVVINCLYRQIIMKNGVPFPITMPRVLPSLDDMTDKEFNEVVAAGLRQAAEGASVPLDDAFASLIEGNDG